MLYLAVHQNSPGRRKFLFSKARGVGPSHLPRGIRQASFVVPVTACNSFEGIYEYIIFFVYLDDLRAVVRNTSNTTTPNTISLSCSLVDFPNWLSLEITPPLTFHKQRWCETRYLGIRSIFAFFFFIWAGGRSSRKGVSRTIR